MTHNVHIRLAKERLDNVVFGNKNNIEKLPRLYTPGEILTCASGFMGGHGTYPDADAHVASVAGVVQQVNKLISVQPIKNRYDGAVGDVVVGRITEVQQKRWKRKRSVEDEHMMRKYLQEGDLISAEVQKKGHDDGSLLLYTRSSKYGKPVPREDREVIARLRNCILALANCRMMLYDTSIQFAYDESMKYEVSELLQPGPILDICNMTQQRLEDAES
ncbi:Exosome complex component RRP4 [Blattella germanica]|nr:Exosome complex component RRP4 [Blattella germanica]